VYYLDSVSFNEDESTYKNNSALIGGVIYCTKCNVSTLSNIYQYNLANEGGVIYIESDAYL
jgi:predicted outer membrane repeat protein